MEDSPLHKHKKDALTGSLLHTAVVAIGILEPQTHFGSIFLEVKKLFGVKGSTSLPMKSKWEKKGQKIKTDIHKREQRAHYSKHYNYYCSDQRKT